MLQQVTAETVAPTAPSPFDSHEVTNTPSPLAGHNAYLSDQPLREALHREGAGWAEAKARDLGAQVGDPRVQDLSRQANRHIPEFRPYDSYGRRVDVVEYHPAYHDLMSRAIGAEVHSLAWTTEQPGGHVARAALSYLWNQIESGVGCPTGMTYAAAPVLRTQPETAPWAERLLSSRYDPRVIPAAEKHGATVATTLTEKHGGCDLRANATTAKPVNGRGPGQAYLLTGHKWFCSAPMGDILLTTALTEKGPGLFVAPRFLDDGARNRFFVQGLKEKCGNRSNASSHIEFHNTWALLIGEEGKGIRTAMTDVHFTRLDFAVGSSGLMRWALNLALHYGRHRRAFQRSLVDLPLMSNVLADMALELEGNIALCFRAARALDEAASDRAAAALSRIGPPIAKFWCCKRPPAFIAEALECIGGNGYIEDMPMARLYREAPLNGIWEGSTNMVCLDVFRAIDREPDSFEALFADIDLGRGAHTSLDRAIDEVRTALSRPGTHEFTARRIVERLALVWQASLLVRQAPTKIADAFVRTRIEEGHGPLFGRLDDSAAVDLLHERALTM